MITVVFFSNVINHHQALLADELYNTEGVDYHFVETVSMPYQFKINGYADYSYKPYIVKAWEDKEQNNYALHLALTADVALFCGQEVLWFAAKRASTNKLSFEVSERWLKKGLINLLSPRLIKNKFYYFSRFRKHNFYKLCSSAFTARDEYFMHSYKNRCYKWGYFTKTTLGEEFFSRSPVPQKGGLSFMWCARMIDWKHPEMPILLMAQLKKRGYVAKLDMFGSGPLEEKIAKLIQKYQISDCVKLCGNKPNDEILTEMRRHDVFLFTSDQNEGWGAVANESMSNGCVLVASDMIGSVPYLINDGINGLIFKSNNMGDLFNKVEWLYQHVDKIPNISNKARQTINTMWSPEIAAANLIVLVRALLKGEECQITDGPCSKAFRI